MKYSKNQLHEVIFEIKFPIILKLYTDREDAASEFQEQVKSEFPNVDFEKKKKTSIIHENTGGSSEVKTKDEYLTWIFSNGKKQIQLTGKNVLLVCKGESYTNFEEFMQDVHIILKALREYDLKITTFTGLRFINQINIGNEKQIDEYINPNLHLINEEFENDNLIQSLTKTELEIEGYNLIFTYGQFNPDYPSTSSKKEFILDYDCISVYDEKI
ncbi:TIGR04255 family protein, partial [Methanobrevibacter sp.]|uniref:TIGR04255 family protein n=1 Tax=Methanobrevibacter sp. TaxID=66852 RepID=UPI00388D6FD6